MIKFILCFPFFILVQGLSAQSDSKTSQRKLFSLTPGNFTQSEFRDQIGESIWHSSSISISDFPKDPFIAVSVVWNSPQWSPKDSIKLILFKNKLEVGNINIEPDPHATSGEGRQISQLYFLNAEEDSFIVSLKGGDIAGGVDVHLYYPGKTEKDAKPGLVENMGSLACPCAPPIIKSRSFWCPDGNCKPATSTTKVTHLIVHHSAGTNSSSDWAAVVRSIWDFHVNVNLWSDIGYNWLIDPNGVIYEGRGDNILGAHFCGTNTGTTGVCVMGNFMTIAPSAAAVNSLKELFAWKACEAGVAPLGAAYHPSSGKTLHVISGHRDGCSTSCPGDLLYPLLPALRDSTNRFILNQCSPLTNKSSISSPGLIVKVAPNPAKESVHLSIEGEPYGSLSICVLDSFGRPISAVKSFEKVEYATQEHLVLNKLHPGIYLVRVAHESGINYVRLLIL